MGSVADRLLAGRPSPLGATWDGLGVNFAVFSAHAQKIELCVFDAAGRKEVARLAMPECTDDFLSWEPLSYHEHFRQSNFKGRELAIAAYDSADPDIRASFDGLCDMLTSILLAIRDAMTEAQREGTRIRLAEQATDWLKPLVIRAGGVINGGDAAPAEDARPQNDVDKIMSATA